MSDDAENLRAPVVRDRWQDRAIDRINALERWQIAADIMIKDNNAKLTAFEAHMDRSFDKLTDRMEQRFTDTNLKLESVTSDQNLRASLVTIFKWGFFPLLAILGAVAGFVYDHLIDRR